MPGVKREQIEKAKQVDLLAYLRAYESGNLNPHGQNGYALRDHDSFIVSADKGAMPVIIRELDDDSTARRYCRANGHGLTAL